MKIKVFFNEQRWNQNKNHKRRKKAKNAMVNKQIILVAYIFAGLFLALMVYIGKFIAFDSQDVITNSYNKRQDTFAKKVIRGNILSSDGKIVPDYCYENIIYLKGGGGSYQKTVEHLSTGHMYETIYLN